MAYQGELETLSQQPDLYNPAFLVVASLSGLVAFGISFSVLWFLSSTTPTTFSLVVRACVVALRYYVYQSHLVVWVLEMSIHVCNAGIFEQDSSVHDRTLLIRIDLVSSEFAEHPSWTGLRGHVCYCKTKGEWIILS